MPISIILPDSTKKIFDHEPTVLEVAQSIGERLAKATVGGIINNQTEIIDLRTPLKDGTQLQIITDNSEQGREVVRHSTAHLMAEAVQQLWPKTKVTIGPVIENGFYYDFDSEHKFTPEDLETIEKKMAQLIAKDQVITKKVLSREEALSQFDALGETYKLELINNLPANEPIGVYTQGEWFDLCRGPHIQRTGQIKAFKLLSVAGSYWRGDETREQLQRIYATAFESTKELNSYLNMLEEAKKRDHRKLGKDLGLFAFSPLAPGSPFFTPKGTMIYNSLQSYMREKYLKYGYQEVITPQIFDSELFHQSGHYENYKENMYFTEIDKKEFSVKPMNCPGHCVLYATEKKSYRDLPLRIADFGRLHRYERSGVMHGLTRVRTFCQDDAHIFCRTEQLQEEIKNFMVFLNEVYNELGMSNYNIFLSTRPEKRMGEDQVWDQAEGALKAALEQLNLPFKINAGDGAFYGPKLDIMFVDALNRPWQLGTLQCDFNLPNAFQLTYTGASNSEERPVMLHRAILGSLERFIGVYLEHTAGRLPIWMAPEQVRILNLTDKHLPYCEELLSSFKEFGIRAHLDARAEKLGFKIRQAQMDKITYMIIIGDKEQELGEISVRDLNGQMASGLTVMKFLALLHEDIEKKNFEAQILEKLNKA